MRKLGLKRRSFEKVLVGFCVALALVATACGSDEEDVARSAGGTVGGTGSNDTNGSGPSADGGTFHITEDGIKPQSMRIYTNACVQYSNDATLPNDMESDCPMMDSASMTPGEKVNVFPSEEAKCDIWVKGHEGDPAFRASISIETP